MDRLCLIGIIKPVSDSWSPGKAFYFSGWNSCLKMSGQLLLSYFYCFHQIQTIWLNLSKIYFVPDSKLYTACFCLHNAAIGIKQACSFHASFVDFQINVEVRLFRYLKKEKTLNSSNNSNIINASLLSF